jgi:outer membrane protein assembly factor BamD
MNDAKWYSSLRMMCVVASCLWMAGCSDGAEGERTELEQEQRSVEELYTEARDSLGEQNYHDVERQYPYSQWAARSQIMAAYAYYRGEMYDDAVITLERFLEVYPSHKSVPYAYYMIALCYYEQIADVGRDQGNTRKARKSLRDVVRRYPNTDYARDAKLKLDLTEDHLAGKDMMIGRYYLEHKEYLAAANRFRAVIEEFQTTSHAPEALHRLVEVYLLLGVKEQAVRYAAVLGHNFPDTPWYERSYALLKAKTTSKEREASW